MQHLDASGWPARRLGTPPVPMQAPTFCIISKPCHTSALYPSQMVEPASGASRCTAFMSPIASQLHTN